MNKILQNGYKILVNDTWGLQCDGVTRDLECQWGKYLVTFDNDHLEMAGFVPEITPTHVWNLVADSARLGDLKHDPELAYQYGVDHI